MGLLCYIFLFYLASGSAYGSKCVHFNPE